MFFYNLRKLIYLVKIIKINKSKNRLMAGKIIEMSTIKQLLLMHKRGESNRRISKQLGMDKGTVNSYIQKLRTGKMDIEELLQLDAPVLEGKFISGTAAYTDKRYEEFKTLLPYLEKELSRKHVTRRLLWQEYIDSHPTGYRYTQFCYHLQQQIVARKPSAVVRHIAGEKLYVDFAGDKMEYIDIKTGEIKSVYIFIGCLPYSDYTFTIGVESQSTEDFLYALERCLQSLGGSPQILVPDNLKAAVVKTDRYEPEINKLMKDFANHYGFIVMPTRAYHPRDKATVENHVKIIYSRVYAKLRNERFFSLQALNEALSEKTNEHNQTRMQNRDYSRMEKFLAEEKQLLLPLPATQFEKKYYTELHVGPNNHIYLGRDKHYYSVSYIYIGVKVQIIYTRTIVKIYHKNQLIATHPRVTGHGYSTIKEHLCSSHQYYNKRNPDYYIAKAKEKSASLYEIITSVFTGNRPPEVYYKTCEGLLSLCRKTDTERFEKACIIAINAGNPGYKFIKSLIESKYLEMEIETDANSCKSLPYSQDNIRGKEYYK
jgi:transposase